MTSRKGGRRQYFWRRTPQSLWEDKRFAAGPGILKTRITKRSDTAKRLRGRTRGEALRSASPLAFSGRAVGGPRSQSQTSGMLGFALRPRATGCLDVGVETPLADRGARPG